MRFRLNSNAQSVIWVSRFGGFWGCGIFSGKCHWHRQQTRRELRWLNATTNVSTSTFNRNSITSPQSAINSITTTKVSENNCKNSRYTTDKMCKQSKPITQQEYLKFGTITTSVSGNHTIRPIRRNVNLRPPQVDIRAFFVFDFSRTIRVVAFFVAWFFWFFDLRQRRLPDFPKHVLFCVAYLMSIIF